MGNWSEEQEKQREVKAKRLSEREKMAGYYLDLSKLSFAGLVIGGLMSIDPGNISFKNIYMAILGIIVTYIFQRIGNGILK